MSYLDIARSALLAREESEISPPEKTSRPSETSSVCEISEESEKSPGFGPDQSALAPEEAERLKARIITVVTVDPEKFDRALYEELTARWNAHEAMMASHDAESEVS